MGIHYLIIILTLISPFYSIAEIHLKNDIPYKLDNLDYKNDYKFIISGKYKQTLFIEITKDNASLSKVEDKIEIIMTEYSSMSILDTQSYIISYNKNSFFMKYIISYSSCDSLSILLRPYSELKNVYIKVNIKTIGEFDDITNLYNVNSEKTTSQTYIYDLISGTSLYIDNIYPSNKYLFYIPVKLGNIVQIEFTNIDQKEKLIIYDYSDRTSTQIEAYYLIQFKYYENAYIINYEVKSFSCNYVAFELNSEDSYNSVKITATIKSPIIEYDLFRYDKRNLTLLAPYIYKFYIPVKYSTHVYVYLKSKELTKYKETLTFYEYENRNAINELDKIEKNLDYYDEYKYYYIHYFILTRTCEYIALEKKFNYDIDNLSIEVDLDRPYISLTYLTSGVPKIFDILTREIYRYAIEANIRQKLNIYFSHKSPDYTENFEIKIYEYSDMNDEYALKYDSIQNFNISLPYSFAFSYSPKNKKCNYVAIDVKIKKEIKDVNITMVSEQIVDDEIYEEENEEINEEEEIYEEEEIFDGGVIKPKVIKGYGDGDDIYDYIIIIIVCSTIIVICLIIIGILLYTVIKRSKMQDYMNEVKSINEKTMMPLYPVH